MYAIQGLGSFVIDPRYSNLRRDTLGRLEKPSSCKGCPAYGSGWGFVPDAVYGKENAPVCVYAQGPGAEEEAGNPAHEPLVGKTGQLMDRVFLPLAGLTRDDVSLANTLRCRWNHKNELPPLNSKALAEAVVHCTRAHWRPPEGVKLYVAMGEYALATLTQQTRDFSGWRGYLLPYSLPGDPRVPQTAVWNPHAHRGIPGLEQAIPVLATYHLAYLWREPEAELPAKRDWNKIPQILDGKWPISMSTIDREPPSVWPTYAAFDTEFSSDDHDYLTRYSLATKDRKVWVIERERVGRITTAPGSTLVMHNAPADLPHAAKLISLDGVEIEDTMYAHAVLWTGKVETDEDKGKSGGAMSHKLNFLGSMYARINRWKHLSKTAPITYSGGDALGTMDVWETGLHGGIRGELERDPQSLWVYSNLQKPLVPIVLKMRKTGIAVDQRAADVALKDIVAGQQGHVLQAQAYVGWPINLRSPKQLAHWLFDIEGIRLKRKPFTPLR